MGRNPERDEREYARRLREIVMIAFSVFTERTIEKVTMADIADACGKDVSPIYRHLPPAGGTTETWANAIPFAAE